MRESSILSQSRSSQASRASISIPSTQPPNVLRQRSKPYSPMTPNSQYHQQRSPYDIVTGGLSQKRRPKLSMNSATLNDDDHKMPHYTPITKHAYSGTFNTHSNHKYPPDQPLPYGDHKEDQDEDDDESKTLHIYEYVPCRIIS